LAGVWNLGGVGGGLMIDGAHRRIAGALHLGLLVFFRQAFLERFYALGDIPHDVGNLALPAKHEQHDGPYNEPMPDRQTSHDATLRIQCATSQMPLTMAKT